MVGATNEYPVEIMEVVDDVMPYSDLDMEAESMIESLGKDYDEFNTPREKFNGKGRKY